MHTILRTDPDGEWVVGYWHPGNPHTFERIESFKNKHLAIRLCSILNGASAGTEEWMAS